jgi:thioredoxin 1
MLDVGIHPKCKCGGPQLKLNTDESPRTATAYGIRSIPTVMLFKAGEKKESVIGAVQKSTLEQMVTKYIDG